jgi:phosphohistidine phosphatase
MTASPQRTLVLLRHAKSAWPDVPDHDRPLAARGRRDAPTAGHWLRQQGYVPDQVLCSTAWRARQTWQLAAATLGQSPPVILAPAIYGASTRELLNVIRHAPSSARSVLVVGHDPAIGEVALRLAEAVSGKDGAVAGPQPSGALDRLRTKFPTAAIAVLRISGPWSELGTGQARLASFVTPGEMRHSVRP